MNTTESNLILLLELVAKKADAEPLLKRGLAYPQISQLIAEAIRDGLMAQEEGGYVITQLGIAKVKGDKAQKKGRWISPEDDSRIVSQPSDKVYLPKRRNSYFEV